MNLYIYLHEQIDLSHYYNCSIGTDQRQGHPITFVYCCLSEVGVFPFPDPNNYKNYDLYSKLDLHVNHCLKIIFFLKTDCRSRSADQDLHFSLLIENTCLQRGSAVAQW